MSKNPIPSGSGKGMAGKPGWHKMDPALVPDDLWICTCDCGRTMAVSERELTSGAVKSCGKCDPKPNPPYYYGMNDQGTMLVSSRPLCRCCYQGN